MKNFRGIKSLTIDFNEEQTFISGENNTGKSTVMNAFMWLLFGKDAQDRKDYNIKRLVNGKPIDKTDVEVTAVISVGGETVTLRRAFVERWAKPRGQSEEVFKGNETETSYNDVPMNVTEYQRRINEIIDDSIFKMVTNPLYFANMKWELQRENLFRIAGTVSDEEIASRKPEFADLLDQISGKSFADFKREIAAKKKKAKEQLDDIQPRIDQTQKLMPESKDFDAIEGNIRDLEKSLSTVEEAIENTVKAMNMSFEKQQEKITAINQFKQRQQQVIFDANTAERNRVYESDIARRELISKKETVEREIATLNKGIVEDKREIELSVQQKKSKEQEIAQARENWYAENARTYNGDLNCHSCGQPLPELMKEKALSMFNEEKAKKLTAITQQGRRLAENKAGIDRDIEQTEKALKTRENALNEKTAELEKITKSISDLPIEYAIGVEGKDIPEWVELKKQIETIEKELELPTEAFDTSELKEEKTQLQEAISALKNQLRDRELITAYNTEIEELNQQGKHLSQLIADIERTEFALKSFTKTKIEESEKRINGMFTFVKFKLFDYTQDGNEFETCVPLVHGIPFQVANTAGALNAGLDIINALTKFYNVSAPIFIDNREGVNNIIPTNSQIINLLVTRETSLTIK